MRILILDDDAPLAHMLAQQLERLMPGCHATAVSTADGARQAVRGAAEPFDVLLLDIRLEEPGLDGVALMEELKRISPSSDAIVFTGYDVEDGLRAFDAGAYRYLTKPFDTRELVRILTVLQRERETRRERDWLTILAEIGAQMQGTEDVHALADIIVRGGLRFGFRRARLRLFEQTGQEAATDPELVGVSQAGEPRVEGFEGLRAPLSKLIYSQLAIKAGRPVCFDGREYGPGVHDEFYAAHGAAPPKGHWFKIPLLSGGHPVGALTLDNGEEERIFGDDVIGQLTRVLALFGSQAADALERARLRESERRQVEEVRLLGDIGRQVTAAAAQGDLDALLDEVRRQVGRLMDVTNFMVVLHDLETKTIDFRCQYEEDQLQDRHWRAEDAGLSGYVIAHNEPVLSDNTGEFRRQHGIQLYGRPAQCWLGVPLRVEGRAVGALAVQSYQDRGAYGEREKRLLGLVADQVAGAIHLAYRLEHQAELARQEAALRRLREALPELIRESEELFWHAVLTAITHRDGNSFNRAILLWYDETGEHLLGRMAIGQLTQAEARKAWERDRDDQHTLDKYFEAPRQAWANPTPLQRLMVGGRWPAGGEDSPLRQVRAQGQRLMCSSAALRGCLPDEVLFPPDLWDEATTYQCALLPVKSPQGVLGVLIVDNAFDSEPLRPGDLENLERVLDAAMESWLQAAERNKLYRMGEQYEKVLALERTLLATVAEQGLKAALEALCRQAQALSGADAVVLYPYLASKGRYDLPLVSYVGLERGEEFDAKKKDKPRQQGVTFTVLQSGTLVVPDVGRSTLSFGGRSLAEHPFLQREGFQALIAAPMRQASSGEPLGVLYLDYRSPQRFDDQEVALAEHLAAVGALLVSAGREMERQQQRRAEAERSEQQRRRDMQLLSNIQAQALASDTDEEKLVLAILENAAEMFDRSVDVTLALVEWEGEGEGRREVRRDYRLTSQRRLRRQKAERHGDSLIERALVASSPCQDRRAVACAIRRGERPVGAIYLRKRDRKATFTLSEVEVVEQLARVASLALDNTRARSNLEELSRTIGAVVDPSGLKETLKKVVDSALKVAPDLDCITLWYRDAETGALVAGPQWGVTQEKHREGHAATPDLVQEVMRRRKPIFASVVEREPTLYGDFVQREGIVSSAAFPLRFGTEQQAFGALFFNYRRAHEFPAAEQMLFRTFANVAAIIIHSTQTVELAERRRRRLEAALKVATAAGASLQRDEVLRGVLTVLRDEFCRRPEDETAPYIMLYKDREGVLELPDVVKAEFYRPDRPEYQHRVRLPLDDQNHKEGQDKKPQGITVRVARRAMAENRIVVENIPNVHNDEDYVETSSKTQTEMCAGLVLEGRLLGVLVMKSARPAAFDQEDKKLFEMAAHQVAIAIDRVEIAKQRFVDMKKVTTLAWRAEIAHVVYGSLAALQSIKKWFDAYLLTSDPAVGASKCYAVITATLERFEKMLVTDPFTLQELEIRDLIERLKKWGEEKREKEWKFVVFEWPILRPDMNITMLCNPELLYSALQNVIVNSMEAIKERNQNGRIGLDVRCAFGDKTVEIEVWDNGPGFPEEIYSQVGQNAWSTKSENRGYGLFNATLFLEIMGGTLELRRRTSDSSGGAQVVFRVPLARK